jgi:hypothetical protein
MKRFPWLDLRKKSHPERPLEPPLWFGNISNGEYFRFATKKDRLLRKLILEKADENARYVGMERRQFLASAMGMATTLWTLGHVSACSSKGSAKDVGNNIVPADAMVDNDLACKVVMRHPQGAVTKRAQRTDQRPGHQGDQEQRQQYRGENDRRVPDGFGAGRRGLVGDSAGDRGARPVDQIGRDLIGDLQRRQELGVGDDRHTRI